MKKIPKVITQDDLRIAFQEGSKAYCEGLQSWSNPYKRENEELIQAWLDGWLEGWKASGKENQQRGNHSTLPP
jgi:hypothetical protein